MEFLYPDTISTENRGNGEKFSQIEKIEDHPVLLSECHMQR